jgi:protein-tyrosine phosphatase
MELITDAAVQGKPQMVFCKLGKDRTGVMAALILSVCGVSEDEIIADYARSDGIHKVALGGLEKMRDVQGMDEEIFSRAPPEAMRKLMDWSRERYGERGLVDYLVYVGFGEERQRQLRVALTRNSVE